MVKRCVWVMSIGLVLLGGAWNFAGGVAYDLTKLKSVCVRIESLDRKAQDFGLREEAIKNYVYVWLKGKLPRLQVDRYPGTDKKTCAAFAPRLWIYITIGTLSGRRGHYGDVNIHIVRKAIWESGVPALGIAYSHHFIIKGGDRDAPQNVKEVLDLLLTDFAAEYYKAGNP